MLQALLELDLTVAIHGLQATRRSARQVPVVRGHYNYLTMIETARQLNRTKPTST